jgi:hypothetical protein
VDGNNVGKPERKVGQVFRDDFLDFTAGLDSMIRVREEGSGGGVREQREIATAATNTRGKIQVDKLVQGTRRGHREQGEKRRHGESQELAGRGIADFTENCGATCAGCGGKVRGALMEGFISEQSESECFFGVNGDAEARRGEEFDLA